MKNLNLFQTISPYNTEIGEETMSFPNVSLIESNGEVMYNNALPPYDEQYLTFIPKQDGTFKFKRTVSSAGTISYSIDYGTTWTVLADNTNTPTIEAGHKVYFKGSNLQVKIPSNYSISYNANAGIGLFSSSCDFDVEGNVASIYFGDAFTDEFKAPNNKWYKNWINTNRYLYYGLFAHCNIVNAENLILPCNNPNENYGVSDAIYQFMFGWCSKLEKAPALNNLKTSIYGFAYMFQRCTSLTTAPILLASELKDKCYTGMFEGCSSLNYIKCLATDISADSCTNSWLKNVNANGTFVKKNGMSSWSSCNTTLYNGIPCNWTVETANS